jgi:hypothetical protein
VGGKLYARLLKLDKAARRKESLKKGRLSYAADANETAVLYPAKSV